MDRMAGLQDLQDKGCGLGGGCLDRMAGLQDYGIYRVLFLLKRLNI